MWIKSVPYCHEWQVRGALKWKMKHRQWQTSMEEEVKWVKRVALRCQGIVAMEKLRCALAFVTSATATRIDVNETPVKCI